MVTVAFPVWNSKEIAWLPMEGLCRQETSLPWELLICEEVHDTQCGSAFFESYWEKLKAAGCVSMKYFELVEWVNLPKKWRLLAQKARGEAFVLQAADCYPDSGRLQRNYEGLKDAHWTQDQKGHFYRVGANKLIQWTQPTTGPFRTGLNMALRTELIKDLPDTNLNRGIDHWMLHHIDKKTGGTIINTVPGDFDSLDVDGVNNISTTRAIYFSRPVEPFGLPTKTLDEILPGEIVIKLLKIQPKEHFINGQLNLNIMPQRRLLRKYQNKEKGDVIFISPCKAAQMESLGIVEAPRVVISQMVEQEARPNEETKLEKNENSTDNKDNGELQSGSGGIDTGLSREVSKSKKRVRTTRKAPAKRKQKVKN